MDEIIKRICNKHNIFFVDIGTPEGFAHYTQGQGWAEEQTRDWYNEKSSCAGGSCAGGIGSDPRIWLGIYEDEELRLASFFHEFAHLRSTYPQFKGEFINATHNSYLREAYTWEYSFKFAKRLGIKFSDKVFKYRDECLRGYEWYTIDEAEMKDVASRLMELGYEKEASKILDCDCQTGCENCWRATDRAKKEILEKL